MRSPPGPVNATGGTIAVVPPAWSITGGDKGADLPLLSPGAQFGTAPTTLVTWTPSPGRLPSKGAVPKAKMPPSEPSSQ